MNREQRRNISGGNKKIDDNLKYLDSPVTITEAVQIARGVAEDVVNDYHRSAGTVQVAFSLQLEVIKELLISSGMISEDDFRAKYIQQTEVYQKMQEEILSKDIRESNVPKMEVRPGNIGVEVV